MVERLIGADGLTVDPCRSGQTGLCDKGGRNSRDVLPCVSIATRRDHSVAVAAHRDPVILRHDMDMICLLAFDPLHDLLDRVDLLHGQHRGVLRMMDLPGRDDLRPHNRIVPAGQTVQFLDGVVVLRVGHRRDADRPVGIPGDTDFFTKGVKSGHWTPPVCRNLSHPSSRHIAALAISHAARKRMALNFQEETVSRRAAFSSKARAAVRAPCG